MEFDNKRLNPKFRKTADKDGIVSFKVREARWTGWLSFNKMKLYTIPSIIFSKLMNLKHLYMSQCRLTGSLPVELGYLKNLETIDFSVNKIAMIPDNIFCNLKKLKTLDMRCNKLTSIPYTIEEMFCLEELSLAQNQLVALPHTISRLPNLKTLDCSKNMIRDLQGELFTGAIKDSLIVLNMDFNLLEKIPRQLGELQFLEELGLEQNNLYILPATAKKLMNIQVFRYSGNKWASSYQSHCRSSHDLNASFGTEALTKILSLACGPE